MMVRQLHRLLLVLGGVCLLAGAAGLVVWSMTRNSGEAGQGLSVPRPPAASSAVTPVEVETSYQQAVAVVATELKPLVERQLTVADLPQLASARDRLVYLSVPALRQRQHLELVLKLSLVLDLLKSAGSSAAPLQNSPSLSTAQDQLRQLLTTAGN